MTPQEAIDAGKLAGDAAALAIWERDEKQDRGCCGGAMLELKRNTKLFKAAVAAGVAGKLDGFVHLDMPAGIRSQNMDIPEAQYRAFRQKLIEAGYEKAIRRFWTYVD
jgi:hypothetical protein